jgi:hypothetical protein
MVEPYDFSEEPKEKSDLIKLKFEVLDQGPEAALPCKLSNIWISMLSRDLDMLLDKNSPEQCYLTAPLSIIIHILCAKRGKHEVGIPISEEELFKYFQNLHIELALEILSRNSDISIEPATLDTIFTNRDVCISQRPSPA